MRPDRDRVLLTVARIWSERGTCSRAKVGAVISREGRILVQGYNGAPAGMEHCNHGCDCANSGRMELGLNKINEIYGQCHPDCLSQQPCTMAVHAEANAIAYAAKAGVSTRDADLHTTLMPCLACSMLIINSGVTRVRYGEEYRDNSGLILLRQAHIDVEQYDMIDV